MSFDSYSVQEDSFPFALPINDYIYFDPSCLFSSEVLDGYWMDPSCESEMFQCQGQNSLDVVYDVKSVVIELEGFHGNLYYSDVSNIGDWISW